MIQNLYGHIVPTQLLMKIREIAQGDVSTCICFTYVCQLHYVTYATLIACIQYIAKYLQDKFKLNIKILAW